ncbi:hypothetical protein PVNG_00554 [Plasmodium vivax North Korean]|uniref:Variable surface protein n=1 Tax=Plasmodium vivax North Korean TaxID=1035514 RepID=A0A0J9TS89_PLAVI|nr:hypothetical protein PVNG_00554 [Plasmodium vivax North Korean]
MVVLSKITKLILQINYTIFIYAILDNKINVQKYYNYIFFIKIINVLYDYVNIFPVFNSIILEKPEDSIEPNKTSCKTYKTNNLTGYKGSEDLFIITCAKYSKYIDEITKDPKYSKTAFCKYINYWLYDTLQSMNPQTIYLYLNRFYSGIPNLNDCREYQEHISESTYGELKKLYNIYDDFIKFKAESLKQEIEKCNYGDSCVTIYKDNVKKCKEDYENPFCTKLIEFRKEYENHKTEIKKCMNKMVYLTPIQSNPTSTILISSIVMSTISSALFISYKVVLTMSPTFLNTF